jgi:ESAT-6 family protein
MSELRVSSEVVRGAGSRADALMNQLVQGLAECDRIATSVLGASWSGPASAMFASGWTEWHRGATEVQTALAGIAELLGQSAVQYEQTESAVSRVSEQSSVTVSGSSK